MSRLASRRRGEPAPWRRSAAVGGWGHEHLPGHERGLRGLRAPRAPGQHRVARRAPRRRRPGGRRERRGRAALRHRPHPRRGEGRLAPRPQRPGHARLRRRRGLRGPDVAQGHRPRQHRRVLRRQEQLVGHLRAVGVHAVRPRRRAPARRRPREVGRRGPRDDHRGARAGHHASTRWSSATTLRSARSTTTCKAHLGQPLVDVRSPQEYSGERTHMPDYPQEGAAARRPHPGRRSRAVGPCRGRRRHLPVARRAARRSTSRSRASRRTTT